MTGQRPPGLVRVHVGIGRAWALRAYIYRAEFATQLVGLAIQVFLLGAVWTAIYAGRESIDGIPRATMVSYVVLASAQTWLLRCQLPVHIRERVREGKVATDLIRPVGFIPQAISAQLGTTFAVAPFLFGALLVAGQVGAVQPPASVGAALLYLCSFAAAYLISVLLGVLLGLIAFWTLETSGMLSIYDFVMQFCGGVFVPLWFMPSLARDVIELLPFQFMTFVPASIYLGTAPDSQIPGLLLGQLLWCAILFAAATAVWRRAVRRVVIQGG
jgi:viologen exporter family transport system permease protein